MKILCFILQRHDCSSLSISIDIYQICITKKESGYKKLLDRGTCGFPEVAYERNYTES
jgi:hypothetical protein